MREIKFRGKRTGNGEWVYGWYIKAKGHWNNIGIHEDWIICHAMQNCGWFALGTEYPVIPETVGQYTGLKDKNGVDIYEGDVLHCVSRRDSADMVVIFADGEFRMVLLEKYEKLNCGDGFYAIRCFDKEVIGNIHEQEKETRQ